MAFNLSRIAVMPPQYEKCQPAFLMMLSDFKNRITVGVMPLLILWSTNFSGNSTLMVDCSMPIGQTCGPIVQFGHV